MSSNPQVTIGVSAVDKASQVLDGVDSKVKASAQVVEQSGQQMIASSDKMALEMQSNNEKVISRWSHMSDSIQKNAGKILTAGAGLSAGIVGFATSFGTLEKAQLRVDQSNLMVERSQAKLEKLQTSGKATAEELARAQEDLRVKTEQLRIQQGDLGDTYTNFLANVPSQLISFGTSAVAIMNLLGISHKTAGTGATTQAAQTVMLGGALRGANAAAAQASLGMRLLHVAMGPVGWVILGVGTAITLLATNVGGIRDRFFEFGQMITQFLDVHFKPLADAIRWFNDNVLAPLGQALGSELPPAIDETSASLDNVASSTEKAAEAILTFDDFIQDLGKDIVKSRQENEFYLRSIGAITDATGKTNDELENMAHFLRKQEEDARRTRLENFDLVASHFGLHEALELTNSQLNRTAQSILEYEERTNAAKEAIDKLSESEDRRNNKDSNDGERKTGTFTSDGRLPSALREARAMFGDNVQLNKKGDIWVPAAFQALDNAESRLDTYVRKFGKDSHQAIRQREIVEQARQKVEVINNFVIKTSDPNTTVEMNGKSATSSMRTTFQRPISDNF